MINNHNREAYPVISHLSESRLMTLLGGVRSAQAGTRAVTPPVPAPVWPAAPIKALPSPSASCSLLGFASLVQLVPRQPL